MNLRYQILFETVVCGENSVCLCNEKDINGDCWSFCYTEEQAKDRVEALEKVGVKAWYESIDDSHWVNDGWIG